MTLLLPGCKNNKNKNKKGDVINNLVLQANVQAKRKNIYSDFTMKDALSFVDFDLVSSLTYENGFIKILDTQGEWNFISPIAEQPIASALSNTVTTETYKSKHAGGYLRITDSDKTTIKDALGNTLIENSEQEFVTISVTDATNPKQPDLCYAQIDIVKADSSKSTKYFVYDEKGQVKSVATIDSDINDDYGQGSTISGLSPTSLDDYGHKGYKRFKNSSRFIIFDNNNPANEIASFTDPNADAEFFAGDYFIYQNSIKLDDNNNNYDYINASGERYALETYKINYLTAKSEAIKVNYVISTTKPISPLFDEKSVYNYVYTDVRTISDKKMLSSTVETFIIDSAGALHDNVTGIDLGKFERIGKNFYNTDSKTIYDGNLNEISILSNMKPRLINNADVIICNVEGNYGAINSEGKVVIPFKYDQIVSDYLSNNRLLALADGKLVVLTFNVSDCTFNVDAKFDDYSEISYITNSDNLGCGVFSIRGKATEGHLYPDYLCLASSHLVTLQTVTDSQLQVQVITANAIDRTMLLSIEKTLSQPVVKSGLISITH